MTGECITRTLSVEQPTHEHMGGGSSPDVTQRVRRRLAVRQLRTKVRVVVGTERASLCARVSLFHFKGGPSNLQRLAVHVPQPRPVVLMYFVYSSNHVFEALTRSSVRVYRRGWKLSCDRFGRVSALSLLLHT